MGTTGRGFSEDKLSEPSGVHREFAPRPKSSSLAPFGGSSCSRLLNPCRCHRRTLSGFTINTVSRQIEVIAAITTGIARSSGRSFGFFTCRDRTTSRSRRAVFCARSSRRVRIISREKPRTTDFGRAASRKRCLARFANFLICSRHWISTGALSTDLRQRSKGVIGVYSAIFPQMRCGASASLWHNECSVELLWILFAQEKPVKALQLLVFLVRHCETYITRAP